MTNAKILVRRDTAANWTSANPVLANGEMGFETDTNKLKIGNGTKAWKDLAYFSPDVPATFFDGGFPSTKYTTGPVFDLGGVN